MKRTLSQSGSAFFIILLAIAMFAGLSYAVYKGSRTTASYITEDQARLMAREIVSYADAIAKAVHTLRLRGVTENQLDVSTLVHALIDSTPTSMPNPACTSDSCRVFNISGGAVNAARAPETAINTAIAEAQNIQPGSARFYVQAVKDIGSNLGDLVMQIPFLKKDVCLKINDLVGVTNPGGNPPVDGVGAGGSNWFPYSGNMSTFPTVSGISLGDTSAEIAAKSVFCTQEPGGSGNQYYFHAVMLAR